MPPCIIHLTLNPQRIRVYGRDPLSTFHTIYRCRRKLSVYISISSHRLNDLGSQTATCRRSMFLVANLWTTAYRSATNVISYVFISCIPSSDFSSRRDSLLLITMSLNQSLSQSMLLFQEQAHNTEVDKETNIEKDFT